MIRTLRLTIVDSNGNDNNTGFTVACNECNVMNERKVKLPVQYRKNQFEWHFIDATGGVISFSCVDRVSIRPF